MKGQQLCPAWIKEATISKLIDIKLNQLTIFNVQINVDYRLNLRTTTIIINYGL